MPARCSSASVAWQDPASFVFGKKYPGSICMELYRFFSSQDHADALAAGQVRLTTLGECRRKERDDPGRDSEEGVVRYDSGSFAGEINEPHVRARLKNLSFITATIGFISAENISLVREMEAYVLCMTYSLRSDGGKGKYGTHGVAVKAARHFFEAVSAALQESVPIRYSRMGRIWYGSNHHSGSRSAPTLNGFLKTPNFEGEMEYRMIWMPEGRQEIKPFGLDVPRVAQWCERFEL